MKRIFTAIASLALLTACVDDTFLTKSGLDPERFLDEYEGQPTALYTLTNESGMEVCITNFGGRIVSIMAPTKDGSFVDVVHGFDCVQDYYPENNQTDFGAAIGRYANRIKDGKITVEGIEYQLPQNNYGHCLHGGPLGWQYQVYDVVEVDGSHITLLRESPDGDADFPGNVSAYVTYTLNSDNSISIIYEAETDAPTVINMTNHSYFNLSGDPKNHSITEDWLSIDSDYFTPVDDTFMTTGEIRSVAGTPMDFRVAKKIGQDIEMDDVQLHNGGGYDHNWVLNAGGDMTVPAATLSCDATGIVLDVYTNEPGIQIYSGNFLDGTVKGKDGVKYAKRSAICLETQHYPDSPNKPQWPSVLLRPGEKYLSMCTYAFSVAE